MSTLSNCSRLLVKPHQLPSFVVTCTRSFNYQDKWFRETKLKKEAKEQKYNEFLRNHTIYEQMEYAYKLFKKELNYFVSEKKRGLQFGQYGKLNLDQGDFEKLYTFHSAEDLDKWQVNCDADYYIGKSKATLTLTQNNTALFSGNLSLEFDKPELTKSTYSGYVNMMTHTIKLPFSTRAKRLDLEQYTHFLLRVRGDGRNYIMNLSVPGYHVENEFSMWSYPLYTRGGPYWQVSKIPFAKFAHSVQGRFSDRQYRFDQHMVRNIGFTVSGTAAGPFALELDWIGLVKDDVAQEEHAWESYQVPKGIANT